MKTKNKRVSNATVLDPKKFMQLQRGSFLAKAEETESRNAKVRISILIGLDVLNFFKERASQPGALEYQTQMNHVLRAQMEGKETVSAVTLAQDDPFNQAVAQRVKAPASKKRKST